MGLGFDVPPAQAAPAHAAAPQIADDAAHAPPTGASSSGVAQVAATGMQAANDGHGPRLTSFWNHLFGGPRPEAGDGRPYAQNHIGAREGGGAFHEDGPVSKLMRGTPYLGDYWEALSVTHDSAHFKPGAVNAATAVTNVGLAGPLMGLVDAPFRAFGHSLFLDHDDK